MVQTPNGSAAPDAPGGSGSVEQERIQRLRDAIQADRLREGVIWNPSLYDGGQWEMTGVLLQQHMASKTNAEKKMCERRGKNLIESWHVLPATKWLSRYLEVAPGAFDQTTIPVGIRGGGLPRENPNATVNPSGLDSDENMDDDASVATDDEEESTMIVECVSQIPEGYHQAEWREVASECSSEEEAEERIDELMHGTDMASESANKVESQFAEMGLI
jgi:hypothetical protein